MSNSFAPQDNICTSGLETTAGSRILQGSCKHVAHACESLTRFDVCKRPACCPQDTSHLLMQLPSHNSEKLEL